MTNLTTNSFQVATTVQSPSGPVVQQVKKTYQTFSWGIALAQVSAGSDSAPQRTTYTYYDPSPYTGSSPVPLLCVTHPDGSWEYYNAYDDNGNPTEVYSSFGDLATNDLSSARYTTYDYIPSDIGTGSIDDGTIAPTKPRMTVQYLQGQEVSRGYAVYPSVGARWDIHCTVGGAAWNAAGNLFTTNLFYTNGPNQFSPRAVIRPDGTMTTYNYAIDPTGTWQTNTTVTGQPDTTFSYIVGGVSNQTVLNIAGYATASSSYDVLTGILLSQDTSANFDGYGRPQQVTHLDGTTNQTYYACCGLESTIDADGLITQYLYDAAKRPTGYEKIYGSSSIIYTNILDAAGRIIASIRIGTDDSVDVLGQSLYDLAGRLLFRTNALGGVTAYSETNDPTTGGLIRTMVHPDGGTATNFYYADGSIKKGTGTAVHTVQYFYGVDSDGPCTTNVNVTASGGLNEWAKTSMDMLYIRAS